MKRAARKTRPQKRRWGVRGGLRMLLVPLFLLLTACEPAIPVFVLTVDTLRPDHLPIYGYHRDTAPAITRLAQDGVVFTRAFTTAPKTTPAYASMFTGEYPFEHGLTTLGQALPRENVTLAELLADRGYRTGGFVSSTVMIDRLSELGQGFNHWDDTMSAREPKRANFERHAPDTVDAALEWLGNNGSGKGATFFFLHLIDPHGPYTPPARYRRRYRDGGGPVLPREKIPAFQRLDDYKTLGDYIDAYDGEIAHADAELGRLIDQLKVDGVYDDALIIFAADHGESFGSDDVYFRHGVTLTEASTRIPFIIKPPRSHSVKPRFSDAVVSLIDVLPTVLDYVGAESPRRTGMSLRPIIDAQAAPVPSAVPWQNRIVFSSRRTKGRSRLAAHGRYTTVRTVASRTARPEITLGGREHPSAAGMRPRLAKEVARRFDHERRFEPQWRYKPTDKQFVERFMEARNDEKEPMSEDDFTALRRLGYIE